MQDKVITCYFFRLIFLFSFKYQANVFLIASGSFHLWSDRGRGCLPQILFI